MKTVVFTRCLVVVSGDYLQFRKAVLNLTYPFADIDLALLEERLRYAAARGCTVAMMVASPGSGSQRNAERHGFRIAYTRTKWRKS